MPNKEIEQLRLKKLLAKAPLTSSERAEVERQLDDLKNSAANSVPQQALSRPKSDYVLGVFDRQRASSKDPGQHPEPPPAQPQPEVPSSPMAPELATGTPEPDISSEENEMLCKQVADIADRIVWLRAFWVTTLSPEVEREAEGWLAKLQHLATKLPEAVIKATLGSRTSLLTQPVRNLTKPTISEKAQASMIPPSAPALDVTGVASDFYYLIHEPRAPRPIQHPPGYVPDGLQQFL